MQRSIIAASVEDDGLFRIRALNHDWISPSVGSIDFLHDLTRLRGFEADTLERRNDGVPLHQRRHHAEAAYCVSVQSPHHRTDRRAVRVETEGAHVRMPGEMHLPDPTHRYRVDIAYGVETVIVSADVDVVDVEQDAAIGALGDGSEKVPLGQR